MRKLIYFVIDNLSFPQSQWSNGAESIDFLIILQIMKDAFVQKLFFPLQTLTILISRPGEMRVFRIY